MEVTVCCPSYIRYDLLKQMVISAENGTIKPKKYLFYDNGCAFPEQDFLFVADKLEIIRPIRNKGVSFAWNRLIEASSDIRIIVNDDIEFLSNTIEELIKAFDSKTLIFPYSASANGFSCFMLPDFVVNSVGLFDEQLFNYFGDNDYVRRINLNPLVTYTAIHTTSFSHFGSASIKSYNNSEMERHHTLFRKSRDLYIKKWGGDPGQETFTTPYNQGH